MPADKIKVNDQVKRTKGSGLRGTVKDIRFESSSSGENRDKPPMIVVCWDNGTQSYCSLDALELVN